MVAEIGPNGAVPAAIPTTGGCGAVALATYRFEAAFFFRYSVDAFLLVT